MGLAKVGWTGLLAFSGLLGNAQAADGCTVMLCMAGNWRAISECRPPVEEALRDVARGRGWPSCGMADAGTSAEAVDGGCPPMYRTNWQWSYEGGSAIETYGCHFAGAIESRIDGVLWARTWWSPDGDSVTEWFPAAREALSVEALDDRFERDYAAWLATEEARRANQPASSEVGGG